MAVRISSLRCLMALRSARSLATEIAAVMPGKYGQESLNSAPLRDEGTLGTIKQD
jgi:hypothetical protein